MLRDEAVAGVQRRLGFFTKRSDEIVLELQAAQNKLENGVMIPQQNNGIFLPWFLVSELATAPMVAGEERIPLPSDLLNELEDGALWIYDSAADPEQQWKPLAKDDLDFLKADQPGEGEPNTYATLGGYFRLKPTPDSDTASAKTLKLFYRNQDTALTTNIENKWLKYAPLLLVGEAGLPIAQSLRDTNAITIFNELRKEEAMRLFMTTESKVHVNRRYVMGGEDD